MKLFHLVRAIAIATVISAVVVVPAMKQVFLSDMTAIQYKEAVAKCYAESDNGYECDSM
jgi:hypothetical protein